MLNKLEKLRGLFNSYQIDALLVSNPENRRYLSGFMGTTARLMIDSSHAYLFTDFRYIEQAKEQCPDFEIVKIGDDFSEKLLQTLQQDGVTKLGFESDFLTYDSYAKMVSELKNISLTPVKNLTENLRMIKSEAELKLLRKAVQITDQAWAELMQKVKPGMTEEQVSLELEFLMRRLGAEAKAFDFIVASGERGALPHGVASEKKLEIGDMVTIDCGSVYKGYHSDMTRNFVMGEANAKQQEIYQIVLEAQMAGVDAVAPGIPASVVDIAARNVIEKYGYGSYFGHGTGHGVGLAIHEEPCVTFKGEVILQPGMVITVEPGIYLPGWGGIRIEDTVLVTSQGSEVLTKTAKNKLLVL